jgi:hypothetical protein
MWTKTDLRTMKSMAGKQGARKIARRLRRTEGAVFQKAHSLGTLMYTGVQHFKERINLKALKLLESFSRLACHCDALVFLFYRSLVTPLPERGRNTLLRYYVFAGG